MSSDPAEPLQRLTDEIRFWHQVLEDSRRTIYCHPDRYDEVRQAVDRLENGHLFTVSASPAMPGDKLAVVDHHALEAGLREAVRKPGPLF